MLLKYIWFLTVLSVIEAQYRISQCTVPTYPNGKARGRSRSKLIKYTCSPGFELVGNRYATCRNGNWDTPIPTCVRSGCDLPELKNGLMMSSRNDAWMVFFCLPGFKLKGSSAIYCNGDHWNATAPICESDSNVTPNTSCDFEEPDLCGWTQDDLHDFDWERLNKKTPSSFLQTGPSYDHTYGEGRSGYYMYIESSSRLVNQSARLVSPIFEAKLAKDGCFSFYYHMFGKDTGGLRVYQKPDGLPLDQMLSLSDKKKQKYLLFEMWGNLGDQWYGQVSVLTDMEEDFQIVIEGIRGKKFTSDIAIDDVAILQGSNCSALKKTISTPAPFVPETCEGRCYDVTQPSRGCSCSLNCIADDNCCHDFYELCLFGDANSSDVPAQTTEELPQTQKLVAKSTTSTSTTTTTTSKTTTSTTTPKPSAPVATIRIILANSTTTMSSRNTPKQTTPSSKNVTFQKDAINAQDAITTTKAETFRTTPTIVVVKSTTMPPTPTRKISSTLKTTKKLEIDSTTTPKLGTIKTTKFVRITEPPKQMSVDKEKKQNSIQHQPRVSGKSSAWMPVLITLAVLVCLAGLAWLAVSARGLRGSAALAALRGRARNDPEVRYLHADVD